MASTITVTCPECDKQLKASSEVLGKKIRCKACGATFVGRAAKEPAGKPAAKAAGGKKDAKPADKAKAKDAKAPDKAKAAPANPDNEEYDNTAYGVTHEYIGRRCPDCTNTLEEDQVVCLQCGYNTMTRQKARTVKVANITGGDIFLWLLPGILCVVVILILIALNLAYIFMVNEASFGDDAWYDFLGGKAFKIYCALISSFTSYKCGRVAVNRLIINNKPPEVEDKSNSDDDEDDDD